MFEDKRSKQLLLVAHCFLNQNAKIDRCAHYPGMINEVVGVIGINGSSTCGVETTWANDQEEPGPGVFLQLLQAACHWHNIALPLRGSKASEPQRGNLCGKGIVKHRLERHIIYERHLA